MLGLDIKLTTHQMSCSGHEGVCGVPHRPLKGWVVFLVLLGQSSPLELVVGVELGPRFISFQVLSRGKVKKMSTDVYWVCYMKDFTSIMFYILLNCF